MQGQGLQWLTDATAAIPDASATPSDRQKFLAAAAEIVSASNSRTDEQVQGGGRGGGCSCHWQPFDPKGRLSTLEAQVTLHAAAH